MKNIFDLKNLEDLPENLKKIVGRKQSCSTDVKRLERLFDIAKHELTTDEIIVGFYRAFGVEHQRQVFHNLLSYCVKAGLIERIGGERSGLYKKAQKKEPQKKENLNFIPVWMR